MAGDIIYADIKTDGAFSLGNSSSLQKSDTHHHGIFLKVGCAIIIILLVIVIVLSILVSQFNSARHNTMDDESKEKFCAGENKSGTVASIVSFNSSTAHKSCPSKDWRLHGGKCYWVAEANKSWHESKNDCAMKNSHLMVIRDFIDMSFLWKHLNTGVFYWIGLTIPPGGESWTWVDNNPFDSHLFSLEEKWRTRSMKCAQVSQIKIAEQKCGKINPWICQL
ncbi:C-type lectin-like domain family 1 isoform X2 [Puma concolor]|nr:C-type lectin-like domain family 1 isoform X2 [Puma concolor]